MAKPKKDMKKKEEEKDPAKDQARAQVESIVEMVDALEKANQSHSGDYKTREEAEMAINESPLSVEVRSGWVAPGSSEMKAAEFQILLCTGGPAVRLIGELDDHGQPNNVRVEYQDWGTPWTQYFAPSEDLDKVLIYAQQFYFGE